jgi:hypothetical protein
MRWIKWMLGCVAGVACFASPVAATTISAADLTNGVSVVSFPDVTFTATGGNFLNTIRSGTEITGVSGGFQADEIDLHHEAITITFENPTHVVELALALLWPSGVQGDLVDEGALLVTDTGYCSINDCVVTATGAATATWTGTSGTVASEDSSIASWLLTNPFGSDLISSLTLMPVSVQAQVSDLYSDFSFVRITMVITPEPDTASLVVFGLLGLAVAGRRQAESPSHRR